jgi:hypothetical protein
MAKRLTALALVATLVALVAWMAAPRDDPVTPGRPDRAEPPVGQVPVPIPGTGPRTAIHVLVVDEWGDPIPGAEVTVCEGRGEVAEPWPSVLDRIDEAPPPLDSALTGPDGRAIVEGPAGQSLLILARIDGRAPGLGPSWEGQAASPEDPVRILLHPVCTLEGRVTDVDGRPVPGVLVAAFLSGIFASYEMLPHAPRAVSGEDGRYRMTGLPATTVAISAARPGATLHSIAAVRLPEVARLDIVLPPATLLEGRVTMAETGEPVDGALVVAAIGNGFDSQRQTFRATTAADGRYRISGLPPVRLQGVEVYRDGLAQVFGDEDLDVTLREAKPTTVDVRMRVATELTGTVRGPEGPVHGAEVYAGDARAVTEEDGSFRLWPAVHGELEVRARAPGHQPGAVEVRGSGPVRIVLARGLTIEGVVRGPDGAAVAGARVFAAYYRHTEEVRTDGEGRFVFSTVPDGGGASVQVFAEGFREFRLDDVGLPKEPLEITLLEKPEIVVRGTVRVARGPMPESCVVVVTDHHGSFDLGLDVPLSWDVPPGVPVGEDGRYEVRFAPEEKGIEVRAVAPGCAPAKPVVIKVDPDRDEYEADLALDPGHPVEAVVVDAATGEPVAGAAVVVAVPGEGGSHIDWMDGPPPPTVHAVSDDAGRVRVDHVPAGRYVLGVSAAGYVAARPGFRAPRSSPLRVEISPSLSLAGVLRFADGANPGVVELGIEPEGSGRGQLLHSRPDGSFRCRGLAPGRYTITVDHDYDNPINMLSETLGPFEAGRTDLRVIVRRGLTIRGVVVGPRGEEVAGATIDAEDLEGDGVGAWCHSGADGTFEVLGLPAGRVHLGSKPTAT